MLKGLLLKNQSYRGYDGTRAVTGEELVGLIERVRLTPSSVNKQALKYYPTCGREKTNQIQPLTAWAKALKKGMPYEGHCPRAFIVIYQDTAIPTALKVYQEDVGIVAQTMLLRAAELGLNGCVIGSFQKNTLHEMLEPSENPVPLLVVAAGKPDETIVLRDVNIQGGTAYYRDAQDVHRVPKRTTKEPTINGEQWMLRNYQVNNLSQMCRMWNAIVTQGNIFSQLGQLDEQSDDVFSSSQSRTRVCIDEDTVVGLCTLYPNNVGRCGHVCNASFAVNQKRREKHIGEALVLGYMRTARSLGFRILQFNAVVENNASARRLYENLGFHSPGTVPGGSSQDDGACVNIVPYCVSLTE